MQHGPIARLLGIRLAVIAISNAELVPTEHSASAARHAAALIDETGPTALAPIPVFAVTGQGLDTLPQVITDALRATLVPEDNGFPWLPTDHSFSLAGHSTIITGTLRHGTLFVGSEVVTLPSGTKARVRGLQVHGAQVAIAGPSQRVAVNLRGLEPALPWRARPYIAAFQPRPVLV